MNGVTLAVLGCGGLIIAGLAFYLGRLLWLLKQSKLRQTQKITERNNTLAQSIYTIAWAMRDGQCELSEGCIRIAVLLDHYHPDHQEPPTDLAKIYPGVLGLYELIKDMPTHEARNQLDNQLIKKMDGERLGYETQFKSSIMVDIAELIARFAPERLPQRR